MENYKELFIRYLNNELEGEELKLFLQWMQEPDNLQIIEEWMGQDWDTYTSWMNKDTQQPWEVLKNKVLQTDTKAPDRTRKITHFIYRIAATILLPLAIGWLTYFIFSNTSKPNSIVYNEINVPIGSKTQITLADGTKIWLNAGSKFRYPQHFSGNTREVELQGEGFFEVTKNPEMPFIVKTSEIKIKVLGTSFNVKSYPDERTVETTLVEGLVTITQNRPKASTKEELVLKPNQRATYIKDKGKLILSGFEKEQITNINQNKDKCLTEPPPVILSKNIDTEQYTAWKDNKLIFKNEEFESLCTRLERWFNVKIQIKNPELKKFHYTGTIENETINDIIEILQLTMHFKYRINHSIIEIWND